MLVDSYDLRKSSKFQNTVRSVGLATAIASILYLIIYFTITTTALPRLAVGLFIIFVALLTLLGRAVYIKLFTMANNQRRVLVIGAGNAGSSLAEVIE